MSDIVERLQKLEAVERELAHECDMLPEGTANWAYAETCKAAADLITALRAENERLRAALEDAAKVAEDKATALSQYRDTHAAVQAATAQDIAEEIKTLIGR